MGMEEPDSSSSRDIVQASSVPLHQNNSFFPLLFYATKQLTRVWQFTHKIAEVNIFDAAIINFSVCQ